MSVWIILGISKMWLDAVRQGESGDQVCFQTDVVPIAVQKAMGSAAIRNAPKPRVHLLAVYACITGRCQDRTRITVSISFVGSQIRPESSVYAAIRKSPIGCEEILEQTHNTTFAVHSTPSIWSATSFDALTSAKDPQLTRNLRVSISVNVEGDTR
jgi:hypothetical protein